MRPRHREDNVITRDLSPPGPVPRPDAGVARGVLVNCRRSRDYASHRAGENTTFVNFRRRDKRLLSGRYNNDFNGNDNKLAMSVLVVDFVSKLVLCVIYLIVSKKTLCSGCCTDIGA